MNVAHDRPGRICRRSIFHYREKLRRHSLVVRRAGACQPYTRRTVRSRVPRRHRSPSLALLRRAARRSLPVVRAKRPDIADELLHHEAVELGLTMVMGRLLEILGASSPSRLCAHDRRERLQSACTPPVIDGNHAQWPPVLPSTMTTTKQPHLSGTAAARDHGSRANDRASPSACEAGAFAGLPGLTGTPRSSSIATVADCRFSRPRLDAIWPPTRSGMPIPKGKTKPSHESLTKRRLPIPGGEVVGFVLVLD